MEMRRRCCILLGFTPDHVEAVLSPCNNSKSTQIKKLLTLSSNPRLKDINENCLDQFRKHWECLEQNNQQLWHCRPAEMSLNACVFEKLVCLCLCSDSSFPPSSLIFSNLYTSYACRQS